MSLSNEEENFARFALLLSGKCSSAVRSCFDGYFHPFNLSIELHTRKTDLEELKIKKRILKKDQWQLLFPNFGSADSKTFDVTLMICLIRNLKTIHTPLNGFDSLPLQSETSTAADLARIKYYRNYLAHLDKSEMDDVFFNAAWSEIANAVGRLGGEVLLKEVNELRIKKLDHSNHSIMTAIEKAERELKQALTDSERRPLQCLIDSTKDMMAFKLKEIHVQQPRAENKAYEVLTERRVLFLAGREGSGKTTMAFHLMKRIAEENTNEERDFTYIELKNTTDLKTVHDNVTEDDNFILFIDDPFGKSNTNKSWFDEWGKYFKDLHVKLQNMSLFVIFAIRDSILSECKYELSKIDLFSSHHIVNLSSDEFSFSKDEKYNMLKTYCSDGDIEIIYDIEKETNIPFSISNNILVKISKTNPVIGFPQACKLFFSDPNIFKTGLLFFKKAREGLKESIELFYSGTEYDKKVLAVLVLMLLEGGEIDLNRLSCDTEPHQQVCNGLGIKVNNRDLKNVLHKEKNYFMLKDSTGECYNFKHETILESILIVFGQEKKDQFILVKHAKGSIVTEFLRSSGYKPKPSEICLLLHKDLSEQLLDRLLQIYTPNINVLKSEIAVIGHPTFQDKAMGVLLLELIEKRNIINSQMQLEVVFKKIALCGHDQFLDLFLRKFCRPDGDRIKYQLSNQFIRSTLAVIFLYEDHVSVLQKISNFYPTLLNVSQEVNDRGKSDYITIDKVNESKPLILTALDGYNSYKCVKFLLEQPVDLTVCDSNGNNALHLSVQHTWTDITKEIIRREPQMLNQSNNQKQTPFMKAAWYGHVSNVKILINYSNDFLIQDKDGQTVLHLIADSPPYKSPMYATERPKDNLSSLITQLVNKEPALLNLKNKSGETPIFLAIKSRNQSNIQTLLDLNADLTLRDNKGNGLLHICASYNMITPAKRILEKNMEFLNLQNVKGRTPLIEAVRNSNDEFFKFLYHYDPDLTIKDLNGNNILHFCNDKSLSLCETIINLKKDLVYEKNYELRTPIEHLVINSNDSLTGIFLKKTYPSTEAVKCLLRFESSLCYIDKDKGHTLLHLAAEYSGHVYSYSKIYGAILQYEPSLLSMKSEHYNNMTPLLVAADKMNRTAFSYLFSQCKDIDCTDNDGNTVLHYCMRNILTDIPQFWLNESDKILQKKLNLLYVKNKNGAMPLLFGLESSLSSVRFNIKRASYLIKFILDNKASLGQKTKDGENVLHLLARSGEGFVVVENKMHNLIQKKICNMIEKRTNEDFFAAMQKVAKSYFHLFLEVNWAGRTPIMVAALTKNYKMFQIFLQSNPFAKRKNRITLPLYFYSFPEFRNMIKEDRVLLFLVIADMLRLYRRLTTVGIYLED